MSSFLKLTKINIKSVINAMFARKNKKTIAQLVVLTSLFVLLMCASFGGMYWGMAEAFSQMNLTHYVFIQAGIVTVFLIVLMVAIETSSGVFRGKDKELLASMPIKDSVIISSKLASVLFSSYIYAFITLAPSMVVYFIYAPFDVGLFFLLILAYLFFPILPTIIGVFLGAFAAWLGSFVKSKVFSIILSLLLSVAVILFSTFYQDIINFYLAKGASFVNALNYVVPSVGLIQGSLFGGIWWHFLIFVALNLVVIAPGVAFATYVYKRVNFAKIGKNKTKKVYYRQKSQFLSLLQKERKLYFNNVTYVTNTIMFCLILIAIPMIIYFSGLKDVMPNEMLPLVVLLCLCTMAGSCYVSSVSISIEGKRFQNMKSMPITSSKYIWAKILFNVLLVLPFALIAGVLSACFFAGSGVVAIIAYFVLPVMSVVLSSCFGILLNLLFPKMQFSNDAQVVKQSLSGVLGMFGGMVFGAVPFVIELFVYGLISINYWILINFCYFCAIILIISLILNKKSNKLVENIQV